MPKKGGTIFSALLFLSIFLMPAAASDDHGRPKDEAEYVMVVQNGKPGRIVGTVIYEDDTVVMLRQDDGSEVRIEKETIFSMVKGVRFGSRVFARDPNISRSIIGPTARPLDSGRGYLALSVISINPPILAPNFSLGLGDFLTVNAGGVFLSGEALNWFLNGKVSFARRTNRNLSLGTIFLTLPDENYDGSFGAVYGLRTFGGEAASLNLGLGLGFSGKDISGRPMLIIGGEFPASARAKILIESWTNLRGFNITSFGLRFFNKQLALDISLVMPWSSDGLTLWPFISPAYNFSLR